MRTYAQKQGQPQQAAHGPKLRTLHRLGNQTAPGSQPAEPAFETDSGLKETARFGHEFSRLSVNAKAPVQTKTASASNSPGDACEQEAEHVAEQMSRLPGANLQLERLPVSVGRLSPVPPIVQEVLSAPGQPLDPATRKFMEPRLGYDLSPIRLHVNAKAAQSARALNALAYTVGRDVVFGNAQYAPETAAGQRLMAHELTHVVQQSRSAPLIQRQKTPDAGATGSDKTDAFKQAGIDSPRRYLEAHATELLVTVLSQSKLLKNYFKTQPEIVAKKFIQHDSDEEFEKAYIDLNKIKSGSEEMNELKTVRGFYHPKTDTIHLRPRANYGEALHEALHKHSDGRFRAILGHPLDEGVTQYFTDRVLEEQGLPAAKTLYDLDCANDLFALVG